MSYRTANNTIQGLGQVDYNAVLDPLWADAKRATDRWSQSSNNPAVPFLNKMWELLGANNWIYRLGGGAPISGTTWDFGDYHISYTATNFDGGNHPSGIPEWNGQNQRDPYGHGWRLNFTICKRPFAGVLYGDREQASQTTRRTAWTPGPPKINKFPPIYDRGLPLCGNEVPINIGCITESVLKGDYSIDKMVNMYSAAADPPKVGDDGSLYHNYYIMPDGKMWGYFGEGNGETIYCYLGKLDCLPFAAFLMYNSWPSETFRHPSGKLRLVMPDGRQWLYDDSSDEPKDDIRADWINKTGRVCPLTVENCYLEADFLRIYGNPVSTGYDTGRGYRLYYMQDGSVWHMDEDNEYRICPYHSGNPPKDNPPTDGQCNCNCVEETIQETLYLNPIRQNADDVPINLIKTTRICDPAPYQETVKTDCDELLPDIARQMALIRRGITPTPQQFAPGTTPGTQPEEIFYFPNNIGRII